MAAEDEKTPDYETRVKEIWHIYHAIEPDLLGWVRAMSSRDVEGQILALSKVEWIAKYLSLAARAYAECPLE